MPLAEIWQICMHPQQQQQHAVKSCLTIFLSTFERNFLAALSCCCCGCGCCCCFGCCCTCVIIRFSGSFLVESKQAIKVQIHASYFKSLGLGYYHDVVLVVFVPE